MCFDTYQARKNSIFVGPNTYIIWKILFKMTVLCWSLQSCLTLCDPRDQGLPGSSVHGILQARVLEWIAIPFSRETSQPRDWTLVSCLAGRFFAIWAAGKMKGYQLTVR